MTDDQRPLFTVDKRPLDSYGLRYLGQRCRDGDHGRCVGYWADSLRTGKGTRCACLCHEKRVAS